MSRITEDIVAGTPDYMAPEQFRGETCPASDQYALAVMAYAWLCGTSLQGSYSYTELRNQHMYGWYLLAQEGTTISPAIEEVVLTALAKYPHKRFASVQAFADALEKAYLLAVGSGTDLPAPSSPKNFLPWGVNLFLAPMLSISSSYPALSDGVFSISTRCYSFSSRQSYPWQQKINRHLDFLTRPASP